MSSSKISISSVIEVHRMPEAVISDIQTAGDSYNLYEESVESSIFDELLRNTTKLNNNPYKKLKTHKKRKNNLGMNDRIYPK